MGNGIFDKTSEYHLKDGRILKQIQQMQKAGSAIIALGAKRFYVDNKEVDFCDVSYNSGIAKITIIPFAD